MRHMSQIGDNDMELHITENHLKVLALFTKGYRAEYYIREVYKKIDIGLQTTQRILDDFEYKGILISRTKGKIRVFALQDNQNSKDYLILTEQYKKIIFLQNNLLIKEIVEKITPHIKGISLIFGSYAKEEQDEESDLDLCIIGEFNKTEIFKVSKTYNISLNIKNYSLSTFEEKKYDDFLLKEIIQNHVIITQPDQFIERVL